MTFKYMHQAGRDQFPDSLGPKLSASSLSVAFATDASFTTTEATRDTQNVATYDHSGAAVTTADYTEIIASTSGPITRSYLADTSGRFLILALGAMGSEVDKLYLNPGIAGWNDLNIPAGTRVSIKALDADTTAGRFIFTGLS